MPEPIKTRGKLERRGEWVYSRVVQGGLTSQGGRLDSIIDTACEVLNDAQELRYDKAIKKLAAALTTAGCVREVGVERFQIPDDEFQSEPMFGLHDTETGWIMRFNSKEARDRQAAALNRLSQQTGRGE